MLEEERDSLDRGENEILPVQEEAGGAHLKHVHDVLFLAVLDDVPNPALIHHLEVVVLVADPGGLLDYLAELLCGRRHVAVLHPLPRQVQVPLLMEFLAREVGVLAAEVTSGERRSLQVGFGLHHASPQHPDLAHDHGVRGLGGLRALR